MEMKRSPGIRHPWRNSIYFPLKRADDPVVLLHSLALGRQMTWTNKGTPKLLHVLPGDDLAVAQPAQFEQPRLGRQTMEKGPQVLKLLCNELEGGESKWTVSVLC